MVFLRIDKGKNMNLQAKYSTQCKAVVETMQKFLYKKYINRTTLEKDNGIKEFCFVVRTGDTLSERDNTIHFVFETKKQQEPETYKAINFKSKGSGNTFETKDENLANMLFEKVENAYTKQLNIVHSKKEIIKIQEFNTFLTKQMQQMEK